MLLFTEDTIVYIEKLRESTIQTLELMTELSKVAGYKVNIKNIIFFLSSSSKQVENLKVSSTIVSKT